MSVLAVKTYIAGQAGTVSMDGMPWARINAFAQFPREDLNGAECLVVASLYQMSEKRLRGPRGAGTKERSFQSQLIVQAVNREPALGGNLFDTLVERICNIFRAPLAGQVPLVDPVDGGLSTLTHIGEDIRIQAMLPTDPVLAEITFRAMITLPLTELISPA